MKLLPSKQALSTVLLSCTLLFTFSAFAEEASLERSLAATIQAQGQKAARDLSAELSNSIKAELNRFSLRYATVKPQEVAVVSKQSKLRQQKQQTSEE
ncbi:hypothetical protein [Cognaticolwellia mytili]|uniref:hypothetical protein n=1 Tax=Cognaticolwellia mytili TaxID=1888913 RepID=UPI000A16D6D0|nr:hypothetical protein [Cognaticolwellia mytili]